MLKYWNLCIIALEGKRNDGGDKLVVFNLISLRKQFRVVWNLWRKWAHSVCRQNDDDVDEWDGNMNDKWRQMNNVWLEKSSTTFTFFRNASARERKEITSRSCENVLMNFRRQMDTVIYVCVCVCAAIEQVSSKVWVAFVFGVLIITFFRYNHYSWS